MLRWGGTVSPFKDYHVNADCITNLLQMHKMVYSDARAKVANIVKGIGIT